MMYVNEKHLASLKYVMLEIKLPREINKSPEAFEYVVNSLFQGGGIGKPFHRQWKGALPAMSSLEIASIEGTIHFYIRTQTKFRPLVEANLYAQYPNIEVVEADDYTKLIRLEHNKKDVSIFGISSVLSKTWKPYKDDKDKEKKDFTLPADFLPIKTYVDFGLNKDPKEEYKNDPIVPMLEFFGSLGEGQYGWYQILLQDESVFDGKKKFPKSYFNKITHERVSLGDMAEARKKQIRRYKEFKKGDQVIDQYGNPMTRKSGEEEKPILYGADKTDIATDQNLGIEEKDEIEAINRKISKPLARCIIRTIFISKKDKFSGNYVQNVLSASKPFGGYNGFRPNTLTNGGYDYDWQNTFKKREPWRAEELFNDYVERAGFHPHTGIIKSDNKIYLWEDIFFYNFKTSTRNLFHTIYETVLHPFGHPETSDVFTLNTEEIATLYHFPGETASVPTLPRIDSIKGKAPTNLPL